MESKTLYNKLPKYIMEIVIPREFSRNLKFYFYMYLLLNVVIPIGHMGRSSLSYTKIVFEVETFIPRNYLSIIEIFQLYNKAQLICNIDQCFIFAYYLLKHTILFVWWYYNIRQHV